MREVLSSPFNRWGNGGTEKLSNLLSHTARKWKRQDWNETVSHCLLLWQSGLFRGTKASHLESDDRVLNVGEQPLTPSRRVDGGGGDCNHLNSDGLSLGPVTLEVSLKVI